MCAQGEYDEATSLFDRAAAGARHALSAGGASSVSMSAEPSPWALRETLASACSGPGQGSLGQKQWAAAEEPLSEVCQRRHQSVYLYIACGAIHCRVTSIYHRGSMPLQVTCIMAMKLHAVCPVLHGNTVPW